MGESPTYCLTILNKFMSKNILTAKSFYGSDNILESDFVNDNDRLKYMKHAYKNMSVIDAFSKFYGLNVDESLKSNRAVNNIYPIEVGKTYLGTVKEINKKHILFEFPGCKDEIECKDPIADCIDNIVNYLRLHDNKLLFKVNSKSNGKFNVGVFEAYYQKWIKEMNNNIRSEKPILVHIDYNIKGGYACHTHITTLLELTGKAYTHFVFIPGSLIVLNIEHNFDKWIGQDVAIIPQNFTKYFVQKAGSAGETENSLVGSRKRVLELQGMMNLEKIYNNYQLLKKTNSKCEVFKGTVTGIIRSNKKMGVFIELDDMYITGLMPVTSAEDLVDYKVGDSIDVCIKEFEVQEGKEPFIYDKNNDRLLKVCCRPVFESLS